VTLVATIISSISPSARREQLEPELARADPVDRRQMAHQHEVPPAIRVRAFDREKIGRRLEHADLRRIALRAAAEAAYRLLRQHPTALAVPNRLRRRIERAGEPPRGLALAVEQMERHPLRRFLADAGQALERLDQLRKKRRVNVRHRARSAVRTAA
jgi:hypothetical protein